MIIDGHPARVKRRRKKEEEEQEEEAGRGRPGGLSGGV